MVVIADRDAKIGCAFTDLGKSLAQSSALIRCNHALIYGVLVNQLQVKRACIVCKLRISHLLGNIHVLRSEEHTSELQSLRHLVCRLLLEKKRPHLEPAIFIGVTDGDTRDLASEADS